MGDEPRFWSAKFSTKNVWPLFCQELPTEYVTLQVCPPCARKSLFLQSSQETGIGQVVPPHKLQCRAERLVAGQIHVKQAFLH